MTERVQRMVRGIAWTGVGVAVLGGSVLAFNPQPDPPGHYYGLLGLVTGQRMAVHVVNRQLPDRALPPGPCRASIQVLNMAGDVVARRDVRVMPGQAASLTVTVDPSDPDRPVTSDPPEPDVPVFADPPGGRTLVRAQVLFRGEAASCLSSAEVIERDGRSSGFLNPGTIAGFNPQPDPPGRPFGR